jgi:hypothetical protein
MQSVQTKTDRMRNRAFPLNKESWEDVIARSRDKHIAADCGRTLNLRNCVPVFQIDLQRVSYSRGFRFLVSSINKIHVIKCRDLDKPVVSQLVEISPASYGTQLDLLCICSPFSEIRVNISLPSTTRSPGLFQHVWMPT